MTKADIINEINKKTGIERLAVRAVVDEFMDVVKQNMAEGENVYLRGFGTFDIIERKEKIGRNITKHESLVIPAHKIPHFKPSPDFKKVIK